MSWFGSLWWIWLIPEVQVCVLGVRHILNGVGESPLLGVFLAYDVISQKLPFAEGDEGALAPQCASPSM